MDKLKNPAGLRGLPETEKRNLLDDDQSVTSSKPVVKYFSKKIPEAATAAIEKELSGLDHGKVTASFHVRDGLIAWFVIAKETSVYNKGEAASREQSLFPEEASNAL